MRADTRARTFILNVSVSVPRRSSRPQLVVPVCLLSLLPSRHRRPFSPLPPAPAFFISFPRCWVPPTPSARSAAHRNSLLPRKHGIPGSRNISRERPSTRGTGSSLPARDRRRRRETHLPGALRRCRGRGRRGQCGAGTRARDFPFFLLADNLHTVCVGGGRQCFQS
jgi:hypothetical protein